jgi:hypothetical protein
MAGIMTIVEANVPEDDWPALCSRWQEMSQQRPPQVVRSWLLQGLDGSDTWCAVTVWRSSEARDEYGAAADAADAVKLFRSVNAESALAVLEIMAES